MAAKFYKALRWELYQRDIDVKYLARKLLRSESYVRARLKGDAPWELDECYQMMDLCRVPYERFGEMFPPEDVKAAAAQALAKLKMKGVA